MPAKSAPPFVVRNDHIIHSATGQKLDYLRVVQKIATPTSLAVVVEFVDDVARRRKEELSWPEFRSWPKFSNKMMNFGYRCDNARILKLLHNWYMELHIAVKI